MHSICVVVFAEVIDQGQGTSYDAGSVQLQVQML